MLHATTSALCYSLAAEHAGRTPALGAPYNDVVAFVGRQRARLATALRVPLLLATLAFALAPCARGRAPFHRLPPAERARRIAAWRGARLAPLRDLVRFYESLTVYALHARLGPEPPTGPPAPGLP